MKFGFIKISNRHGFGPQKKKNPKKMEKTVFEFWFFLKYLALTQNFF